MKPSRCIAVGHGQERLRRIYRKGAYNEKEAWWWNEEVQKAVKEKELTSKQYHNPDGMKTQRSSEKRYRDQRWK